MQYISLLVIFIFSLSQSTSLAAEDKAVVPNPRFQENDSSAFDLSQPAASATQLEGVLELISLSTGPKAASFDINLYYYTTPFVMEMKYTLKTRGKPGGYGAIPQRSQEVAISWPSDNELRQKGIDLAKLNLAVQTGQIFREKWAVKTLSAFTSKHPAWRIVLEKWDHIFINETVNPKRVSKESDSGPANYLLARQEFIRRYGFDYENSPSGYEQIFANILYNAPTVAKGDVSTIRRPNYNISEIAKRLDDLIDSLNRIGPLVNQLDGEIYKKDFEYVRAQNLKPNSREYQKIALRELANFIVSNVASVRRQLGLDGPTLRSDLSAQIALLARDHRTAERLFIDAVDDVESEVSKLSVATDRFRYNINNLRWWGFSKDWNFWHQSTEFSSQHGKLLYNGKPFDANSGFFKKLYLEPKRLKYLKVLYGAKWFAKFSGALVSLFLIPVFVSDPQHFISRVLENRIGYEDMNSAGFGKNQGPKNVNVDHAEKKKRVLFTFSKKPEGTLFKIANLDTAETPRFQPVNLKTEGTVDLKFHTNFPMRIAGQRVPIPSSPYYRPIRIRLNGEEIRDGIYRFGYQYVVAPKPGFSKYYLEVEYTYTPPSEATEVWLKADGLKRDLPYVREIGMTGLADKMSDLVKSSRGGVISVTDFTKTISTNSHYIRNGLETPDWLRPVSSSNPVKEFSRFSYYCTIGGVCNVGNKFNDILINRNLKDQKSTGRRKYCPAGCCRWKGMVATSLSN